MASMLPSVSVPLLILWSTATFDRDVLFVFVAGLVASGLATRVKLELPASNALNSAFVAWELQWKDLHNNHVETKPDEHEALIASAVALLAALSFPLLVLVRQVSPFAQSVVAAGLLALISRETVLNESHTARLYVLGFAALAAWMWRDVLKVFVAAFVYVAASFVLFGPDSTLPMDLIAPSLVSGVVSVAVHDFVVRFGRNLVFSLIQAVGLSVVALVVVETMLELAGEPPLGRSLLDVRWEESLSPEIIASRPELSTEGLIRLAPTMAALISFFSFVRSTRRAVAPVSMIQWQGLVGVASGTLGGVALWARFANRSGVDLFSPAVGSLVGASLLMRFSLMTRHRPAPRPATQTNWHRSVYCRRPTRVSTRRKQQESEARLDDELPFYEHILQDHSIGCGSIPEVVNQALEIRKALAVVESDQAAKDTTSLQRVYGVALNLSHVSSIADNLVTLIGDALDAAFEEIRFFDGLPNATSLARTARRKLSVLATELQDAEAFALSLRVDVAKWEDQSLSGLAEALQKLAPGLKLDAPVDATTGKPLELTPEEKAQAVEWKRLNEMFQAVCKRKKFNVNQLLVSVPPTTPDLRAESAASSAPAAAEPVKPTLLPGGPALASVESPSVEQRRQVARTRRTPFTSFRQRSHPAAATAAASPAPASPAAPQATPVASPSTERQSTGGFASIVDTSTMSSGTEIQGVLTKRRFSLSRNPFRSNQTAGT